MHAILGMAACDLAARDPSLLPPAVHHRMKAIKAIKRCLADVSNRGVGGDASGGGNASSSSSGGGNRCGSASAATGTSSAEEANAMIATCFALTFQSVTFADGMAEYMAFLRGIIIVAMQMCFKGIRPMFVNLLGEESNAVLGPFMADLPVVRRDWVDDAVAAVAGLAPLCRDEVEVEYQQLLMEMVQLLYTSSWDGAYFSAPYLYSQTCSVFLSALLLDFTVQRPKLRKKNADIRSPSSPPPSTQRTKPSRNITGGG